MSKKSNEIHLIVVNQTISAAFFRWLSRYAEANGKVELWTGNPPTEDDPCITIKKLPTYRRTSIKSRLLTWIRFVLVMAWRLLFVRGKVPVFAITNPPFTPLVLHLYNVLFGVRYGLLEYDIYPQVIRQMGLVSERNILYRIWYRWHKWSLLRARLVLTLSEDMANELKVMTEGKPFPLQIVPTWADDDWIRPIDKDENPFVAENSLQDKFVVLYSGNLGATHSIETIIDVAQRLNNCVEVLFVIVGDGTKKALVEDAIESGRISNMKLLPLQPFDMLPYSFSSADVAIVTLSKGYGRLSMPSKTYDMMAAGNAILGISEPPSSLNTVLSRHKCGKNFSPHQIDAVVDWIKLLVQDTERLKTLQNAARQAAEQHFSVRVCESALTEAVKHHLIKH